MQRSGYCLSRREKARPGKHDLAKLSVVGNVGDMMARENHVLIGVARWIAEDGVDCGQVRISRGINCYGLSTRPLHICLSNSDDSLIPGISRRLNLVREEVKRQSRFCNDMLGEDACKCPFFLRREFLPDPLVGRRLVDPGPAKEGGRLDGFSGDPGDQGVIGVREANVERSR